MLIYLQTDSGPVLYNMAHVISIEPHTKGCVLYLDNDDKVISTTTFADLLKLVAASGFTITYAN